MKYFIHARKSTDNEECQILSIEDYLVDLKEFAAKEKLEIIVSFCEAQTVKEPEKNIGSNFILDISELFFFLIKLFYLLSYTFIEV